MSDSELNQVDEQPSLYEQEHWEREIAQVKFFLDSNPRDVEALVKLGNLLQQRGEIDSAIIHLREAIRINPDHAEAHYQLGFILTQHKDELEAAIAQFREAIYLNSFEPSYHSMLGSCLLKQGKLLEAIDEYQEAIRLMPSYIPSYVGLAMALDHAGQQQQAKTALQKAKDLFKAKGDSESAIQIERLINCL